MTNSANEAAVAADEASGALRDRPTPTGEKIVIGLFLLGLRIALAVAIHCVELGSFYSLLIALFMGATFVSDRQHYAGWRRQFWQLRSAANSRFAEWANLSIQLVYFASGYVVVVLLLLQ